VQCDVFDAKLSAPAQEAKDVFDDIKMDEEINGEIGNHIKALWADPAVQDVYAKRSMYQLSDSAR
jgi:hypothetical protein